MTTTHPQENIRPIISRQTVFRTFIEQTPNRIKTSTQKKHVFKIKDTPSQKNKTIRIHKKNKSLKE